MIKKWRSLVVFSIMILIMLSSTFPVIADVSSTEIQVLPQTQNVSPGENFTVNITITPAQPIRGVEFKLSFNPSLLHADSVTEGNLFNNYNTLFNNGTIDNINGSIINVYSAILGEGNTSVPGTFATISFTAKQQTGISTLHLFDVRITNETDYVPIIVHDGSVTVGDSNQSTSDNSSSNHQPENHAPNSPTKPSGSKTGFTNTIYNFSTTAFDQDDDEIYYLFKWDNNTDTDSIWLGPFSSNQTCVASHSWNCTGIYEIKVKAKDSSEAESSWSPLANIVVGENGTGKNNSKPLVDFSYSPDLPTTTDIIQFMDQSTDMDGNITTWLWDFGDNTATDTQRHPTHRYETNGSYLVTLTILDNDNAINITYQQITVSQNMKGNNEEKTPPIGFIGIIIAFLIVMSIIRKK